MAATTERAGLLVTVARVRCLLSARILSERLGT